MKFSSVLAVGVALLGFALVQTAQGAIVYQQPTIWAGTGTDVGRTWSSQTNVGLNGFRTNDNFSLASAATINEVSWEGIYVNNDLTNGSPNTTDWIIRFEADNAGAPGAVLSSETLLAAQVARQLLGTGIFHNNSVDVYQFTAPFQSFNAAGATTYWFSPLSRGPTFAPQFGWIQGTGGDGASFQTSFTSGVVTGAFVREGDRAFALSQVPEPSTLVLIGVGLASLASLRRRLPREMRARS